jgi:hypothetical protein
VQEAKAITLAKVHCYFLGLAIAFSSLLVWFFSTGIQLQPRRLSDPNGWQEAALGGGIKLMGQFVLRKGESTENGKIGIKLLNITSKDCPFATICLAPQAKATLRFYKPVDGSIICEPTLESDDTSYKADLVCSGLPFTYLEVREINTREDWALISIFKPEDAQPTR